MRDRYNAFIDRHNIAWELGMAFLAIVFVAVGFAVEAAPNDLAPSLLALDLVLTIVFVLEFTTRFVAARDRTAYLRGHWIDAIAMIPTFRGLRLARLVRLFRLFRAFAGVYRAVVRAERFQGAEGIAWVVAAWAAVTVIACTAIYAVESGINPAIQSPYDAIWWGIETITTVGYGDIQPVTGEGRLAASGLMLIGVVLFSTVTGIVTSSLISARHEGDVDPIADLERLARLKDVGALDPGEFEQAKARVLGRV